MNTISCSALIALLAGSLLGAATAHAEEKPMKAKTVYYSGMVQGVGFRATTARIAGKFPVTGWVKNLSDGRVEMLVEGPEDAVDQFLAAVRQHWKGNIEKEQIEEKKPGGKFKRFEIVR